MDSWSGLGCPGQQRYRHGPERIEKKTLTFGHHHHQKNKWNQRKKVPWPWPQVGPCLCAGPLLKVGFFLLWICVGATMSQSTVAYVKFRHMGQFQNTGGMFVVNLCHEIICTSGKGIGPFCDHICHTSRKMSMILSVCSPTRCFRKFTWHFLDKRKVPHELITRRARKNLGNGELQMLQMRKMLSSGFRISNSWMSDIKYPDKIHW